MVVKTKPVNEEPINKDTSDTVTKPPKTEPDNGEAEPLVKVDNNSIPAPAKSVT